ncbi:MAG: P1 family peptidase [Chloroflexi bacterium]|nr:P1 family peptidase [Chloroflexota bacterium]
MHPHLETPSGKKRARALGIPFDGTPGPANSITDVAGVAVGYSTLIRGDGKLVVGHGPVRTGVTAILPRPRERVTSPAFAGYFSLNGAGEMTGTVWIDEAGRCGGPITITNTHSVGVARDATIKWMVRNGRQPLPAWWLPVAAETYDGYLNDTNGFHVRDEHVFEAVDSAKSGPIEEGSVGGGTGMIAYEFKAGSGTSSRVVRAADHEYTVGVFVQANFGLRSQLTIAGVPAGRHLTRGTFRRQDPEIGPTPLEWPAGEQARDSVRPSGREGSIIVVVATDAPLLPHQLKRMARRAALGVGRSGSVSTNGSGDIFLAFSTANEEAAAATRGLQPTSMLPEETLDPLFAAVVRATDEAIVNSLVANETKTGRDGHTVLALPHEELVDVARKYGR